MCSYAGPLVVTFAWSVNGHKKPNIQKNLGDVPVMVKVRNSLLYNIYKKSFYLYLHVLKYFDFFSNENLFIRIITLKEKE